MLFSSTCTSPGRLRVRDDIVRVVAPQIAFMTASIAAEQIVKLAIKYVPSIESFISGTWLLMRSEKDRLFGPVLAHMSQCWQYGDNI